MWEIKYFQCFLYCLIVNLIPKCYFRIEFLEGFLFYWTRKPKAKDFNEIGRFQFFQCYFIINLMIKYFMENKRNLTQIFCFFLNLIS